MQTRTRKITLDPETEAGLAWILSERNAAALAAGERPISINKLAAMILADVVADDAEAQEKPAEVH